jgi:hypothetical protein
MINSEGFSSVKGLANLTSVGSLSIFNTNQLLSLKGLDNLVAVEGDLSLGLLNGLKDLKGLNKLKTVAGSLSINKNEGLTSFEGLNNLDSVGNAFTIEGNYKVDSCKSLASLRKCASLGLFDTNIRSLEGFGKITKLTELRAFGAHRLANFNDLSNLQIVTDIRIRGCNSLKTIGLSSLSLVGGVLELTSNNSLSSLAGLNNLKYIGGDFTLQSGNLGNVKNLTRLDSVGGSFYIGSDSLVNMNGLDSLKSVKEDFRIYYSPLLLSLEGLKSLKTVGKNFVISDNPLLRNLSGLDNLTTVNEDLSIDGNTNLGNILGLRNLKTIGRRLDINTTKSLKDLQGLENLKTFGGGLYLYGLDSLENLFALTNLKMTNPNAPISLDNNKRLSRCAFYELCQRISNDNSSNISLGGNATGCNSKVEIQPFCRTLKTNDFEKYQLLIAPNPAENQAVLTIKNMYETPLSIEIIDVLGKRLYTIHFA